MISTCFLFEFHLHVGEGTPSKDHIQMKVVTMLQFSATKSPFAKYFGLKDFFCICWKSHYLLRCHTGHRAQMYSTIQCVCLCVCLCGRTSGWKKIHLWEKKKRKKNLLTCHIAVVR